MEPVRRIRFWEYWVEIGINNNSIKGDRYDI